MTRTPAPTSFVAPADLRAWLERHHGTAKVLLVCCYKQHATHRGTTYFQALDEALCFGWIDGVRHRVDEDSFSVRFTPRKPRSKWSALNIKRFRALEAGGRVRPLGREAFRAERGSRPYSYESRARALAPAYVRKLRANKRAWTFFNAQPPWYRRTTAFWVMSAKREATREKRLGVLIASSARGNTIPPLTPKVP